MQKSAGYFRKKADPSDEGDADDNDDSSCFLDVEESETLTKQVVKQPASDINAEETSEPRLKSLRVSSFFQSVDGENCGDELYKGFNAHTEPDTLEGPFIMNAIGTAIKTSAQINEKHSQ